MKLTPFSQKWISEFDVSGGLRVSFQVYARGFAWRMRLYRSRSSRSRTRVLVGFDPDALVGHHLVRQHRSSLQRAQLVTAESHLPYDLLRS